MTEIKGPVWMWLLAAGLFGAAAGYEVWTTGGLTTSGVSYLGFAVMAGAFAMGAFGRADSDDHQA